MTVLGQLEPAWCRNEDGAAAIGEDEDGPAVRLGEGSGALESAPSGNTSAAGGLTTSHSGQIDSTGHAAEGEPLCM